MLSVALLVQNDLHALKQALPALVGVHQQDCPLIFVDQGSQDGTRELLQLFIRKHGGRLIALGAEASQAEATAVARAEAQAEYCVLLTVEDRVFLPGLRALAQVLKTQTPDVALLPGSFWVTSGAAPIPGPDAGQVTDLSDKAVMTSLWPDPRRLLIRQGQCETNTTYFDTDIWVTRLKAAATVLPISDPVLLRPLPSLTGAEIIATLLAEATEEDLEPRLHWLSHAMALLPAAEAAGFLQDCAVFIKAAPRGLRRAVRASETPAGHLLTALSKGDQSAASLQLLWLIQHQTDLKTNALMAEVQTLERQLALALPGPEYLEQFYAHLRGF